MEVTQIEAALRAHVLERYASGERKSTLDPDEDLLASGIVDSMGVIELTSFVEESFGVTVEPEDIIPENFRSLRAITHMVAAKKGLESDYEDPLVTGVRSLVTEAVPEDAVVLVVSHGDEALLALDGRTGWHFPRDEQGQHRGFNPADAADAIGQLEALKAQGATHIVFPQINLWWLEEYAGLRDYLQSGSGEVGRSEAGVVYTLPPA